MLSIGWLVVAVIAAVLLTTWVTFTLTRLDRLHARVDAAQAALDAQLVRRAAALARVAESSSGDLSAERRARYLALARDALEQRPGAEDRAATENAAGRAVRELVGTPGPDLLLAGGDTAELAEAGERVRIARGFYNDAVRDTRALRVRRIPRLFRMAGRRAMPEFFDIDDTLRSATDDSARSTPERVAQSEEEVPQ